MGLSNINSNNLNNLNSLQKNSAISNAVTLYVKGKKVTIKRDRLKKVAKGMAKFAFLLGETDDEDDYAEELEEDIFEAMVLLEQRRGKKKK